MCLRPAKVDQQCVTKQLGDEPLTGYFDSRMLGQAFGNLIKNAQVIASFDTRSTFRKLLATLLKPA